MFQFLFPLNEAEYFVPGTAVNVLSVCIVKVTCTGYFRVAVTCTLRTDEYQYKLTGLTSTIKQQFNSFPRESKKAPLLIWGCFHTPDSTVSRTLPREDFWIKLKKELWLDDLIAPSMSLEAAERAGRRTKKHGQCVTQAAPRKSPLSPTTCGVMNCVALPLSLAQPTVAITK
ncbi:hypothetical protein J6590_029672 [Homalodisca vitripennis]|nr:hypothetical protein J6590_029672 [Homalodisca vitripennis]